MRLMNAVWLAATSLISGLLLWAYPARAAAPGDGWIVWESSREEGRVEIYRARADGAQVTRLTTGGGWRPLWAPDGRWIAFGEPTGAVLVMRPDGTDRRTLTPAGQPAFWLHDNGGFVVAEGTTHYRYDPETGQREALFDSREFPAFAGTSFQPNALTHDNRYLLLGSHLYMNGYTGANGSFRAPFAALAVDLLRKDRVYFLGDGCWPFSPPEGELIYHVCGEGGCPNYPDIVRINLADLATRSSHLPEISHLDPDWGHEYNPRVSSDGQWIVYMTSTGCHDGLDCDYEIFLHRVGAGVDDRMRVTTNAAFDGYPDMYVGSPWQASSEPRPLLTPRRHTIFASAGATPAPRLVKVKNDGGGTLGAWQATAAAPWLNVTQTEDGFQVALREGASLTRGRHQAVVTLTGANMIGAATFPVTLIADETFPAGEPDAGPDAVELDAGVPVDAGPVTNLDAALGDGPASGESDDGGCGCRIGAGAVPPPLGGAPWLLVLGMGLLARKARRRR